MASTDAKVRRQYLELKSGLADYMGFLCFSANWANPVQWSHYADRHRGICLGFDVDGELHQVQYVDSRLTPDVQAMNTGGPAAQAHMAQILATKFRHWAYEQEYRLFVQLQGKDEATGLYFFEFGNSLRVCEVIVGHFSPVTRAEVAAALGDLAPQVEAFKARLAFRSFDVVRQNMGRLWK